jgi:hypothetical protein
MGIKVNKKIKVFLILFFLFLIFFRVLVVEFTVPWAFYTTLTGNIFPTFISAQEAKKRWGDTPFDPIKFKSGSSEVRTSMAYSILTTQPFIGRPCSDVADALGHESGSYWHYEDESKYRIFNNIDYTLPSGPPRGEDLEIVFLWTERGPNCRIEKVVLHKECCLKHKDSFWKSYF